MDEWVPNLKKVESGIRYIEAQRASQNRALREAQLALPSLLSADATFTALMQAVEDLKGRVPQDCDIIVEAFGISVTKVRYVKPHTFVFEGFNSEGHAMFATCHFSQLVAHVVYLPKKGKERVITGFSNTNPSDER